MQNFKLKNIPRKNIYEDLCAVLDNGFWNRVPRVGEESECNELILNNIWLLSEEENKARCKPGGNKYSQYVHLRIVPKICVELVPHKMKKVTQFKNGQVILKLPRSCLIHQGLKPRARCSAECLPSQNLADWGSRTESLESP